jgi:predicted Fe-Mo cluster-binding NifX family protein
MKIAVTYEDGRIFQHFGHTEQFKIYETADGRIVRAEVVDTNGSGHGALADFLMRQGVDALICGGIGGGYPPSESLQMATAVITIGPLILLYPFLQKYIVKGLVIGSVKG